MDSACGRTFSGNGWKYFRKINKDDKTVCQLEDVPFFLIETLALEQYNRIGKIYKYDE